MSRQKAEYHICIEKEENRATVNGFCNLDGGERFPLNADDLKKLALALLELVRLWDAGMDGPIKDE